MPIYDYMCTQCQQRFEASHAINAAGPDCPVCGATTQKMISAPAVHGNMARGRDLAIRSLEPNPGQKEHAHGSGCGCGRHH